MKIGLITIHNACNYGAILQTYATQKILAKYGRVEIINYQNTQLSRSFDLIRFKSSARGLLGTGKDIFRVFPRYRALNKFKSFIDHQFNQTRSYTPADLREHAFAEYDVIIAGSDQIWNPACVSSSKRLDPVYFLQFAKEAVRKISYASSFGGYSYSDMEKKLVSEMLQDFYAISVRESDARSIIGNLVEQKVEHVLDPTLLLSKERWLLIARQSRSRKIEGKYILLYTVPKARLIKRAVQYFRDKLGIDVIALDQGLASGARTDKQIRDAGPEDFVSLFSGAEFVVTDSYHGVCFSLIFGKPFVAISTEPHSNRLSSLLGLVGGLERLVNSEDELGRIKVSGYSHDVLDKLHAERRKSTDFLSHAVLGK